MRRAGLEAVAVLLAAAVSLAGCAADEAAGPQAEATAGSVGVLAGVVVDDAIRPVPDAAVNVTGAGTWANTTTDAGGTFRLAGLDAGTYIVRVSKAHHSTHEQAVVVLASEANELVRFQLVFEPGSVAYSTLYTWDGLIQCGAWPTTGCGNANTVTGLMMCSLGLPCFNATEDRSVELHPIDGVPDFLQSELVWEPTLASGEVLRFILGHATWQELQDGEIETDNVTEGRSPLMVTVNATRLAESSLGADRMLLIQVNTGVTVEPVPTCAPDVGAPHCGVGASFQQPYTTFTHAFYGYRPPPGWLFASGEPVPPPPPA